MNDNLDIPCLADISRYTLKKRTILKAATNRAQRRYSTELLFPDEDHELTLLKLG